MSTPESDVTLDEAPEEEKPKPKLALEVKVDAPSTCQRHVTVTIPPADIERYFKDAFDELQPKAEVPGFRPGRAPRKLVESRFREQMSDQVKGSLLMDSVTQASEDAEFSAISEPDFDFEAIEMPEEGSMTFEFDIEVRPEFEMPNWKGLKLERQVHDYSDDEVDEQLRKLLARYSRLVNKDGDAQLGDQLTIDITFKDGDEVLSEVSDETISVMPTVSFRDGNLEGFDKLVVGCKPGDTKTATVKISQQAEKEDLRGKDVAAEIKVKGVQRLELPELTSSFLDEIGGFEDEDELRAAVREELDKQLAYYQQQEIRKQITGILTAEANWDLPPEMLQRQARRELERAVLELRSSGFSEEMIRAYQNQLRQNSLASTERALKEHFIFERIAEDQEVDADPQDFENEIRSIAAQRGESARRVRARLEKRGQTDALRNQIIERKVVGIITDEGEFTEVPFEPKKDDTAAIDCAISGHEDDADIPEAKYGGEEEARPGQPGQTG